MNVRHPKSVRRHLLLILYDRYQVDPLDMLTPEEVLEYGTVDRGDLMANMHYLRDRGLVELMMGYRPPLFAAARITADGIDLVENHYEFNLRFPRSLDELEQTTVDVPVLVERLVEEAEYTALDGEKRHALQRDVQFLRDELVRPVHRWRMDVVQTVLGWIGEHCEDPEELPSLDHLRQALHRAVDESKR
jgi:hypothetical protein